MISLVIVSHSAILAAGIKELADQMAQGKVPIATAAGLIDDADLLGTDPLMIENAIDSVYSDAGVLVLVDIGSAVMNAQMAIEQLPAHQQANVLLCEAPLVEGAIAAAAQGMAGADLQSAALEAATALEAKYELLKKIAPFKVVSSIPEQAETLTIKVPNKLGLHARPAARMIGIINQYVGQVWVKKGDDPYVSAKSISQVSTLGAQYGDDLTFRINSPQANEIQGAIIDLVTDNFGDQLGDLSTPSPTITVGQDLSNQTNFVGIPAAEGIAISTAIIYESSDPLAERHVVDDVDNEIKDFQKAIVDTIQEISKIQTTLNKPNKEIFEFHLLLLNDVAFINEVIKEIKENKWNASFVWQQAIKNLEHEYIGMSSQYMRERAGDISEIGRKVLMRLSDNISDDIILNEEGILIIDEMGPAAIATLDLTKVEGILMRRGGRMSHAAILARSASIPAIVGLGSKLDNVIDGETIAMDGDKGIVWRADYHKDKIDKLLEEQADQQEAKDALLKDAGLPAETLDGRKYPVVANVRNAEDARKALECGADGIGLFRTDFLFMNRDLPPSEEEQYQAYLSVCQAIEGLPVTIRTLDIGGDKPMPYLDIPKEDNPYLGLRAIRYCLHDIDLFKTQLKAICRVSADYDVRLMYPMVAVPEEVAEANRILKEVQKELEDASIAFDLTMEVGIMIEVPSTIFTIPELAAHCDFLSIGTNDLTQYLLAMDRGNPAVAKHRSAEIPAVLNAIETIIKKALDENIEIAMCGELAGDPEMTETLIHFGLEEFSMSPSSIPAVKDQIRKLHYSKKLINDASDEQWMIQHLLRETGM